MLRVPSRDGSRPVDHWPGTLMFGTLHFLRLNELSTTKLNHCTEGDYDSLHRFQLNTGCFDKISEADIHHPVSYLAYIPGRVTSSGLTETHWQRGTHSAALRRQLSSDARASINGAWLNPPPLFGLAMTSRILD
ncbi:uncharacterized protein LOC119579359 [Penaeus monodon]|uniref:uncharacterized protein LOC119579359 n=1 Tax=Penaeus monodon TaxID=6687 RepID=UPI0018A7D5BC|nr:uncharacterized protein LOC119579359 [Penaeus monodon]